MADSKHISLVIHHRGRFETDSNGVFAYVDGETEIVDWVNVDKLSGELIKDILSKIGYPSICELYWLQPGMDLAHRLKLLKYDRDVITMYEAVENNGDEIEVFTKHPISVPVVAQECVPDVGVTNDSPPVTPSKGRRKVRAKRTPTPKKAQGPNRSLFPGEGSNHENGGQEDLSAQPAKTNQPLNPLPPDYSRRDLNLFSQPPQTPTEQQAEPNETNQTQQGSAESAVPLTNQAPFSSSEVHTAGSESTQPQNLHKRSLGSNRTPNSSEVPSNELLTCNVPILANHAAVVIYKY
ncbi:hypothetical protein PIB30_035797 [Stylosanthes scabra]|uniref:PB1-like domain-containing protein n=1 Tax=Stylosanthes scabra TaxID=79078 RepID=A0ABU6VBH7_9FABA|nr:hypothetical protein [Stylosanthes scabra]